MNNEAQQWIQKLELEPHPEGGYFREIFRSDQQIRGEMCHPIRESSRVSATSIYFLLEEKQVSKWHRLTSDEMWYFHAGSSILIHTFSATGDYHSFNLGLDNAVDAHPQILIPAGTIFGAELHNKLDYALIGCMVSPGFEFQDFELISLELLLQIAPNRANIIQKLARN